MFLNPKIMSLFFVCAVTLSFISHGGEKTNKEMKFRAEYASVPVVIDGKLDDSVWQSCKSYDMAVPEKTYEGLYIIDQTNLKLKEPGQIKVAWDDNYLYVAAIFTDTDILAEGEEDQMPHYAKGDLLEVFLKPSEYAWYWELYATPLNKKTSYFFPSKGVLGLPSCTEKYRIDLKVAAQCEGTVNNMKDVDVKWTVEMAVPIKALMVLDEVKFGPEAKWTMLAARYNYSRYLPAKELSTYPRLTKPNYHTTDEYGIIEFAPKP